MINKTPQDIDIAIQYLSARDGDTVEIGAAQKEFIERMVRFQALVLKHSKARSIAIYCKVFGVSKSQAYRDFNKMEMVFGSAKKTNKDFMRELSIIKLENIEQMALEADDFKTAAMVRGKIFDWTTKEDIQPPFDPSAVEAPLIIVGEFPEQFKNSQMPTDPEERAKVIRDLKLKHRLGDHAENIEFEELDDATD